MTRDPLVEVTRQLSEAIRDPGDVSAVPAGRSEAIEKLADALRARARARRRRRVLGAIAVAASAIGLVGAGVVAARHDHVATSSELGRMHEPAGAVTVVRDGRAASLGADDVVAEGSELRTPPNGHAHLDFASGTKVTIGGQSHVRLVEQTKRKRFALETGTIAAKVAKLGPGERFVVATSDSEIEVHGTEFRVSVVAPDASCGGGTPTRLEVTEGVVAVRHGGVETLVAAGETWPRCNAPSSASTPPPVPSEPARVPAAEKVDAPPSTHPVVTHRAPTAPASAAGTSSPLTEQNALYSRAMREKNEGRFAAAIVTLDRLVDEYPGGPLAESARLERMRILASTDRASAAGAAKEYLERHPNGFGRAEAEVLAAEER